MSQDPPEFPAGPFVASPRMTAASRAECVSKLRVFPKQLRETVEHLSDLQLDTPYRNWTIRQIVHHLADSHVNCYVRFKWTLTEETPRIKAYDEGCWSELSESRTGSIEPSLMLIEGLHARWSQLLDSLSEAQYSRRFFHPETKQETSLEAALESYVWHGEHHLGQIHWLRSHHEM